MAMKQKPVQPEHAHHTSANSGKIAQHRDGLVQAMISSPQWLSIAIALLITALIMSGIAVTLDTLFRTLMAAQ